jgi:hypothetical protein
VLLVAASLVGHASARLLEGDLQAAVVEIKDEGIVEAVPALEGQTLDVQGADHKIEVNFEQFAQQLWCN